MTPGPLYVAIDNKRKWAYQMILVPFRLEVGISVHYRMFFLILDNAIFREAHTQDPITPEVEIRDACFHSLDLSYRPRTSSGFLRWA